MFELTVLIFLSLREGVKRLDAGTSERTLKRAHKVRCAAHHDGWPNLGVLAHELLERDESDAVRPVSFLLYGWRLAKREKFNDTPLVVSTGLENPSFLLVLGRVVPGHVQDRPKIHGHLSVKVRE